ncbi:MAG: alpha/beta hydrolase [Anaerolineae bacterium]
MRPLAALMLLSLFPVIVSFIPLVERQRWVRYLPAISVILLILHVFADQEPFYPRMAPAYLLVAVSFALNLPFLLHGTHPHWPRWLVTTGNLLGIVLFTVAVAVAALLFPFHPLPTPTGPFLVETKVYRWVSSDLDQVWQAGTADDRPIIVQVWYPAERLYGARADAGEPATWPFVFYAPGTFGSRSSGASTCLELASQGYVVASIDHPGQSLFTRLPGGEFALPGRQYMEEALAFSSGRLRLIEEIRLGQKWQAVRVTDIRLALAKLAALANAGNDQLMEHIDLKHIGMIGHSLGAGAALQICREDRICGALALLDGSLYGDAPALQAGRAYSADAEPYTQPVLCLLSSRYAQDMENHAVSSLTHALFQQAQGPASQVIIAQSGSSNMTSLILQSPILADLLGGSGNIDAAKGLKLTDERIVTFFGCYLHGRCKDVIQGATSFKGLDIINRNIDH